MNFTEIATTRQSCRNFDPTRPVEQEKLANLLESARLAPSACNGQPYFLTVCTGENAKAVAKATMGMGMNKFADKAPVQIVISEMPYVKSAAVGSKIKGNDYRSIDIGILSAYITAAATAEGLGTCILGWLSDAEIREICGLSGAVRLVITLGYAKEGDKLRPKKRKKIEELVSTVGEEKTSLKRKRSLKFDRQALYDLLLEIPEGKVVTYGKLAEMLGNKSWARAVGNALHDNPDGDKYPCYKVVQTDGKLSYSYAFGGIDAQKRRLEKEGITVKDYRVDLTKYGI